MVLRYSCRKSEPPALLTIFERGLKRVSKRHVRGRWKEALKIRFYGINIEMKQLGHNVIEINLECLLQWFSTTCTIEGLGEEVELSNTHTAYVMHIFQHFETHLGQKKKMLGKNTINFSLRLTSF